MTNEIATTMLVLLLVSIRNFHNPRELDNRVGKYSKRLKLNDEQILKMKPILIEGSQDKNELLKKIESSEKKRDLRKYTRELKKVVESTEKLLSNIFTKEQMLEWVSIRKDLITKYAN